MVSSKSAEKALTAEVAEKKPTEFTEKFGAVSDFL
jgi:hypothetical protein